jgi:hypothetical protein
MAEYLKVGIGDRGSSVCSVRSGPPLLIAALRNWTAETNHPTGLE